MPGKKGLLGLLLALVSMTTGCCRMCDRFCHSTPTVAAAPQCCYVPCCPAGTVAASPAVPAVPAVPAAGWNQPGVCTPCR
jgi:hypothetical protein